MLLRRLLVISLMILFISGIAAQLAGPLPRETTGTDTTSTGPAGTVIAPDEDGPVSTATAPGRPVVGDAREIALKVDGGGRPADERIHVGEHVIVRVSSTGPGQVSLDGLGRVAAVASGTPAVFDLLPGREGRYDVTFRPPRGADQTVGTLLVEAARPGRPASAEPRRASRPSAPARRSKR